MKKVFLPLLIFTLSVASSSGQSLSNKNVFKGEFPLTATFRGNHNSVSTYTEFVNQMTKAGTHIPDLLDLNFFYDTTNVNFANQMAMNYPDRMFLQVKQANGGVPRDYQPWPPELDRISGQPITFPGHWLVKPPTTLTGSITAIDTIISVQSTAGFTFDHYPETPNFPDGSPAMIVELDSLGNKIWSHYEYVYVKAINGNNLTVSRSFRDSPAPSGFTNGRACVAPILANYTWIRPLVWYINFSATCPLDSNGKTASQVIIDDLKTRFGTGGTLSNFSGVSYASGPFSIAPTGIDYNWDGIVDSPSDYYTGVNAHLSSIRQQIDSNFILLSGYNGVDYINSFNGVNNEGLVRPDDPWRKITNALNDNTYWSSYPTPHHLTEETLRIQDDTAAGIINREKWVQLVRMGTGYATCLGSCVDIKDKIFDNNPADSNVIALTWVELYRGTDNVEHWLGHPTSQPIHVAATTPSILGDSVNDWTHIIPKLSFTNGTISVIGNELVLVPNSNQNHLLTISLNLTQSKNLTVLFDVISGGNQLINIIKAPTLSISYQTGADAPTYYSNQNYLTREYYWRGLDSTAQSCTVSFNFKGSDTIRFRSLSAHEAPDCMARSFEHGVVLVNPGLENTTFNLTALFGTGVNYTRLTAPILSVPPQWQAQYQQTIDMNNGSAITNPAQVIVPALNALFLKSQPITTGINEQPQRNEVVIFPNPNSGRFTITSNIKMKEIAVYNILGEIVYSQQNISGNTKQEVDVSTLSKGIYFVHITNNNRKIIIKKIVIH